MERSREVFCPISFNWNSHRIIFNSTRHPAWVTGFGTASALLLPAKQLRSPWGPSAFLHPCLPSQGALLQLQLHLTWGVKLFQELENLPFTSPRERKWDSVKQGWRDGCSLLIIHCRAAGVGFNYCLPSAGRFRFHFGKWWTNPMRVSWSLGTVGCPQASPLLIQKDLPLPMPAALGISACPWASRRNGCTSPFSLYF